MTVEEQIRALTARWDNLRYYAGPGDNDRDGTPTRMDPDEGVGVDCSGWVVYTFRTLWGITLGGFDTAAMASWAQAEGLWVGTSRWVDWDRLQPGDVLLHDRHNNVFESSGPRGHTGIFLGRPAGQVATSESASSGSGVGLYTRSRSFWNAAFRVPGIGQEEDDMTPEQAASLAQCQKDIASVKAYLENLSLPGALRTMHERTGLVQIAQQRVVDVIAKVADKLGVRL